MGFVLPTTPNARAVDPQPVKARNEMSSAFGGTDLRIDRTGARTAMTFYMPPMSLEDARPWRVLESGVGTCIMRIPEPDIVMDGCGSPKIKGAGQAGKSLITDGWTPQFWIPEGKWFSTEVDGLLYAYEIAAAVVVDAAGEATLILREMLRTSPTDNAALNVNPATIEGYASVPDGAFAYDTDRMVKGLSFTIKERR